MLIRSSWRDPGVLVQEVTLRPSRLTEARERRPRRAVFSYSSVVRGPPSSAALTRSSGATSRHTRIHLSRL